MRRRVDRLLLGAFLVGVLFTYSSFLALPTGYVIAVISYGLFGAYHIAAGWTRLIGKPYAVGALGVIFSVYALHMLANALSGSVTAAGLLRVTAFVPVILINLFVIPQTVSLTYFLRTLSRLSAVLVLVGLPIAFFGPIDLGPAVLEPWRGAPTFPVIGPLPMLNSILANPNHVGLLTGIGAASAIDETVREHSAVGGFLLACNVVGLYLTTARASMGLLFVAGGVYLLYHLLGRAHFWLVGSLAMGGVLAMAIVFALATAGAIVLPIDPSGRIPLWAGAWRAITANPILGYGPGHTATYIRPYVPPGSVGSHPHNSYLRLFLTTGIIGGAAYLILVVQSVLQQYRRAIARGATDVLLFGLLLGLVLSQFFEAYSLFGLGVTSVVASILFGFAVSGINADATTGRADEISLAQSDTLYTTETDD